MSVLSTVSEEDVCFNLINPLRSVSKKNYETEINYCMLFALLTIFILCFFFLILNQNEYLLGQNQIQSESINESSVLDYPSLSDRNLKVETVAAGFAFPTGITFLRNNEILLLEKNTGNVYRIVNGNVSGIALHLNVSIEDERGLLGVAVSRIDKSNQDNPFVFLYFTSCSQVKTKVNNSQNCGNHIYRYELDTESNILADSKLVLELPYLPGPSHNGGVMDLDNENNVYVTVGDLQPSAFNKNQSGFDTMAQNILNGTIPDGRAGILRITQDGKPVDNGILGG